MHKLKWSEEKESNKDCPYNHVTAETPFGNFLITWKSWKDNDSPTIDETPWGEWDGAYNNVEEAKQEAEKHYFTRLNQAINIDKEKKMSNDKTLPVKTEQEGVERAEFMDLVGECIGEASMAWSETPKGVFDDSKGSELIKKICNKHKELMEENNAS